MEHKEMKGSCHIWRREDGEIYKIIILETFHDWDIGRRIDEDNGDITITFTRRGE